MNTLQMTAAKEKSLNEIEDGALDTIKAIFKSEIDVEDKKVDVSIKMLGIVAKARQTETKRTLIAFGMASRIATDKQLRKYIEVTCPEIKKSLGEGMPDVHQAQLPGKSD